ncbi:MAG: hypothetical protein COA78_23160 [Blastopirellula sp.]|nr:MAG: hypothetical protein COA78_23160 [Blastopirellula sp.]
MKRSFLGASVFLLMLSVSVTGFAAEITHSFLGCGKANRAVIVNEAGAVEWSIDYPTSDGWVLPSGNILLAIYPCKEFPKGGVIEVERESKKVVFKYVGTQKEISTAQKLEDGSYLIAELGPKPSAVLVSSTGEVIKTTPLQCQAENAHMETRMLRMLPSGNYIAPHLLDFAVKEYKADTGEVVNTIDTKKYGWPFTAIRLESGNTVIGCTNGNQVIEVDKNGKTVWQVTNEDIGEKLFNDACGVQRLPNGNTVVSSYHASGNQVKLFELTPEKKVVWRYSGMKAGFHHFQILTTNGKPVKHNTMK